MDAPQKDYFVYIFQKVFPDSKNKIMSSHR